MDQLVGQTINRYKIVSMLGEGGMGAVYKARDLTLQRDVAFKVMHAQFARQPNFQERFLQEARTAARFDQASIVKVYDFGQQQGMLYIVMELIPGSNLGKLLRDLRARNQWIVLPEAIQLIRQISIAIDYIHQQGITHRDIKPDNIMLKPEPSDGLPYRPVLTDLGLAKLAEGGVFTQDGTSMGTPAYMSPEQALGKPTDRRSDVYSLGILLFELVVGRLPFPATSLTEAIRAHTQETPPTPQSLRPDVPLPIQNIILKAIEKDPANRYQTAADLAAALAQNQPAPATLASTQPSPLEGAVSLITQLQQSVDQPRGPSILKEFPAPPSDLSQDRIQIMEPDHTGRVFSISAVSITIGRDADNTIVLLDQKSSRHHARIDFDGSQYRIIDLDSTNGTFLASARLLPGIPEIWTPDKPLRIGDAYLRLVRSQKGASSTSVGAGNPATSVDPNMVRSSPGQGRVGVYLENAQLSVEPGTPLSSSVTLLNQGSVVDHFKLSIIGIPPAWLPTPTPLVQLLPGDQQTVSFTILPPRNSQSRAGRYPLTLRVASQSAPDQVAEVKATLTLSPYSLFSSELHPSKIKANKISRITVNNNGNAEENFLLKWTDPGDDLNFKPGQTTLAVPEGKSSAADFKAGPQMKRLIGSEARFPFSIQVNSPSGASQTQNGEVISTGLIPPWVIPILMILCLLLAGGGALAFSQINGQRNSTAETEAAQNTAAAVLVMTQVAATNIALTPSPLTPPGLPTSAPSATPAAPTVASAATAAATAAATVAPTEPPTAVPVGGGTGKLAFLSDRSGSSEIYLINVDGTGLEQITKKMFVEGYPSWSPDGKRLAFASNQNNQIHIYVINSNGTGLVNVSGNGATNDLLPLWSPDGTKIAFLSSQGGTRDVYVVLPDGSGLTRITDNGRDNSYISWSPDSSKIAFASDFGNGNWDIFTMNSDGSGWMQLTNDPAFDGAPAWSPDGQKIAFISSRSNNTFKVFVMNADGTGQTQLSQEIAAGITAIWSPNGKKVTFMTASSNGNVAISTINSDGSGLTRLTTDKDYAGAFAWSPDGTHIAFVSGYDVYVTKADGSSRVQLTNYSGIDDNPAWQPNK